MAKDKTQEQLKAEFEEQVTAFETEKVTFENQVQEFEKQKAQFEEQVTVFTNDKIAFEDAKAAFELEKEKLKEQLANVPRETSLKTAKSTERVEGIIYAKNGSLKQQFTPKEWAMMGKDKAGWVEDVEVPKEVQELQNK